MSRSVRDLVTEYLDAVGEKRFDRLEELVHPDASFGGTPKIETTGSGPFVDGFRHLGPIIDRIAIRNLIVEEDAAFVLYDLVTSTEVGPVLCGEYLTTRDGLISSSTLIFDWRRWPEVMQQLQQRVLAPAVSKT